ncbi:hypothetical protein DRE_03037 [Drechslerella stenobrocha 248]|uniref:Low temperature viability protein n=1 Tax=Drechslerella stenobrocha 248 TaxID=1043628 RepID=W7I5T6_9PEZI|nr:hypothetical protein DRE_03037 [Drechslerella stenobrocha 248]
MPRQKWINKKSAQTFTLVHRSQKDPLIHDADASQMVFKELIVPNSNTEVPPQPSYASRHRTNFSSASSSISAASGRSSRIKTISDLESEYGFTSRQNEGEAAIHGIYYDDTEYDYMQHMRDIGASAEAVFIEAPQAQSKQRKGKAPATIPEAGEQEDGRERKKTLEELLEEDTVAKNGGNTRRVQLPAAGFQPDMDLRLREVLEALEDEAYVGDEAEEQEDFFQQLAKSGEVEEFEFERSADFFDEDDQDDGWESDVTEKAHQTPTNGRVNEDWEKEFAKFKKDKKAGFKPEAGGLSSVGGRTTSTAMSFGGDDLVSLVSAFNNRKLKKKKVPSSARSTTSTYSMSSSALFRTEGLTTLDDRFDRIEEEYMRDEEEEDDLASRSSVASNAPEREDFGSILDEFLEGYSTTGKRHQRVRRGKQQTGMEQLDEIRQGLGRARLVSRT